MEVEAMIEDEHAAPANPAEPANELASLAGLAEGRVSPTRDDRGRFLTGNSGGGRPKGAKNRLTDIFLFVVIADFAEHGAETLARLRADDPATYLRLIGALIPRDLLLQREQAPSIDYADLTYEEIAELIETERRRRFVKVALSSA
jgi:hypothetical protein